MGVKRITKAFCNKNIAFGKTQRRCGAAPTNHVSPPGGTARKKRHSSLSVALPDPARPSVSFVLSSRSIPFHPLAILPTDPAPEIPAAPWA